MAARNRDIDMDRIVDYQSEYSQVIKKHTISGSQMNGLCPFHDDKASSFTVSLKTGQYNCFACGASGNFTTFWAETNGVTTEEAYAQILKKYGIDLSEEPVNEAKEKPKKSGLASFSLKEYSLNKQLPEEWLTEYCHVETCKDRDKTTYLKIPYYNEAGEEVTYRKRYGNKEFRWKYGSSGKIILYGEWLLPEIHKAGYAVIVEGESDTQSLLYLKVPVLGVAGASLFKAEQTERIQNLKLYLHKEPDRGGETFFTKMTERLKEGDFNGEVYVWSCKQFGVKDPSELYLKYGKEGAAKKIQKALKDARKIDLDHLEEEIPAAVNGTPVNLRQPEGWIYSEKGISKIDEKKNYPVNICRTPIILTQRLKSMETGEEKIEIAFKRDGSWHKAIYPRSTVFTSRGITVLSDLGCTVTSENAKQVVQFLAALEAENIDIIEKADSTTSFGWQPGNRFLPGHAKDIVLDVDPSQKSLVAAYGMNGSLEGWVEQMKAHRARDKFRFILAASFTAPLLRIIRQRIFFVYNWGGSKGGKAQPLDTKIITPSGTKTMGEIRIGDLVTGIDGKPYPVSGVFPQGEKEIYELTFSDGTKTRCCKEHLWIVSTRTRREHKRGYTVMSLEEIMDQPLRKHKGYNFRIPVCEAVEYDINPSIHIEPYLLGALLGDGCITQAKHGRIFFNNSEEDVIKRVSDAVARIGGHLRFNPYSTNQYEVAGVPGLKKSIVSYGINKRSEDKFIPEDYFFASICERRELLHGLMDTDGTVDAKSGSFKYSTTSQKLAMDVRRLCQSLGYRAVITIKKERPGKPVEYIVCISTDDYVFSSEKHRMRVPSYKRKTNKKSMAITEIRYIGKEECQCIMLDSKDHAYLCDDFIVTHNTAAVKAALSAWGDPERLMVNFNATAVGLERVASFYCDLPLGIDERQLAGQNQGALEKIVYMISSGTSKVRGSKNGGLQAMKTWRTVALANGEEPIATETSQTGVSTRALEIYGGPFDSEQEASLMHQTCMQNCGWAGPEFVGRLIKEDEENIRRRYDEMLQYVNENSDGRSGSHIACIAAVALADALLDEWIFCGDDSEGRAKAMALKILNEQMTAATGDVNENATQFIVDWIMSNKASFGEKAIGVCLGFIEGKNAYIFPSLFNQALTKAGYSPRKTTRYLADKALIASSPKKGGGKEYSVVKWFVNRSVRFIEFHLNQLAGEKDPLLDEEEIAENLNKADCGFQQISLNEMEDIPFKNDDDGSVLPYQ